MPTSVCERPISSLQKRQEKERKDKKGKDKKRKGRHDELCVHHQRNGATPASKQSYPMKPHDQKDAAAAPDDLAVVHVCRASPSCCGCLGHGLGLALAAQEGGRQRQGQEAHEHLHEEHRLHAQVLCQDGPKRRPKDPRPSPTAAHGAHGLSPLLQSHFLRHQRLPGDQEGREGHPGHEAAAGQGPHRGNEQGDETAEGVHAQGRRVDQSGALLLHHNSQRQSCEQLAERQRRQENANVRVGGVQLVPGVQGQDWEQHISAGGV
eukprot:scaffold1130_cov195-Pinguiococcus_pyrenoidosus.AAC.90